jgi:hypothetical protein
MPTTVTNGLDLQGARIQGLGAASAGTDAATWAQVQNIVAGLTMHNSVRAKTTGNQALTGPATVDGIALATGDRVLVASQTTGTQNGIYVVNTAGAWTLAPDAALGTIKAGAMVIVEEGTVNADSLWVMTNDGAITAGTTQVWSKFQAGQTLTPGNGISITNGVISLIIGAGLILDGTNLRLDPTYGFNAHKFAINVPAGATAVTINPGLGTTDLLVGLYNIATANSRKKVLEDADIQSATAVLLTFGTAPAADQYRVVILG